MAQKPLPADTISRARDLRKQGLSIFGVSQELRISTGAASNACRGIVVAKKAAGIKSQRVSNRAAAGAGDKVVPTEVVVDLVNQVREQELKSRLAKAEVETRRVREAEAEAETRASDMADLRKRLVEAQVSEREARIKAVSQPDPGMLIQLEASKADTQRLERQLTEQRFISMIEASDRRHEVDNRVTRELILNQDKVGKTSMDLMSEGMHRVESIFAFGGNKVDRFMSDRRKDQDLTRLLILGISPGDYQVLLAGRQPVLTFAELDISQSVAAKRSGDKVKDLTKEEYKQYLDQINAANATYDRLFDRTRRTAASAHRREPVYRIGASEAGSSSSEAVKQLPVGPVNVINLQCGHCRAELEVDLAGSDFKSARAARAKGEKALVTVQCPKCGVTIDLSGYFEPEPGSEVKQDIAYE